MISALGNRIFLMHDIHRPEPLLFQSRWALSFLRGPMTREQVSRLMEPLKEPPAAAAAWRFCLRSACGADLGPDVTDHCPHCGKYPWAVPQSRLQDKAFRQNLPRAVAAPPRRTRAAATACRPCCRATCNSSICPPQRPQPSDGQLEYRPVVLGFANVVYVVDKRKGMEHSEAVRLLAPARGVRPSDGLGDGGGCTRAPRPKRPRRTPNARWAGVPESLDTGRKVKALEKAFAEHLYTTRKLSLWENRTLGLLSAPGESEAAFRSRCRAAADLEQKQALEMEKVKFRPKFEALDMKLPDDATAKTRETEAETPAARREASQSTDRLHIQDGRDRGEVEAHWRGGDGDPGETAQGGRPCHAFRAGLGALLADGQRRSAGLPIGTSRCCLASFAPIPAQG